MTGCWHGSEGSAESARDTVERECSGRKYRGAGSFLSNAIEDPLVGSASIVSLDLGGPLSGTVRKVANSLFPFVYKPSSRTVMDLEDGGNPGLSTLWPPIQNRYHLHAAPPARIGCNERERASSFLTLATILQRTNYDLRRRGNKIWIQEK